MNKDDIIRMAREVDLHLYGEAQETGIERFFHLAAAAEREACAQTARTAMLGSEWVLTERVMKSIRARGEK